MIKIFIFIAGKDIQEFQIKPPLYIADTNGAGDSFVGGIFNIKRFLSNN